MDHKKDLLFGLTPPQDLVTKTANDFYHTSFSENFLQQFRPVALQKEVWDALGDVMKRERALGRALWPVSGYRSWEHQQHIWNHKASGARALSRLSHNQDIPFCKLTPQERVQTLWRWSAFPGTSRHHWGTDFDIIDLEALHKNPDYVLQLSLEEYAEGGLFAGLLHNDPFAGSDWHRPYSFEKPLVGIAKEPWHISYAPIARTLESLWNFETFNELLQVSEKTLLAETLLHAPREYWQHYLANTLLLL
jgi:LAS superfamily LD-carboxypeptidase LdcB